MPSLFKKIPDALLRIIVVFAVLVGLALVIRAVLPPDLTDKASFVRLTTEREMAKPIRHAGSDVCADCHEETVVKKMGYHRNLSCETCHGPAEAHVEDPGEVKPSLPRMREFCVRCHAYSPSRPTGFPQINPAAHNPLRACTSCHNPHDPKPPHAPRECEACHGEIARTKALSPHVQLECTTCHTVPAKHKVEPRMARATIPAGREFCGSCHGTDASVKETPKIDISTHGEKYLCWQCHYPHMPEVD